MQTGQNFIAPENSLGWVSLPARAGEHTKLLIGPPGAEKSTIAKRIPSIRQALTLKEAIETTKVHSICGLLNEEHRFVSTRPFRSPRLLLHILGGEGRG